MSTVIDVKFKGFKELDRAIQRLPQELQRRAYRSVITTGARVIAKNARRRVPVSSGGLKKSIGVKAIVFGTTPYAAIGPRRKFSAINKKGKRVSPWKYAHLVENGTVHSKATPFIRPAVDESKAEVLDKMSKGLSRFLTRAVSSVKSRR